MIVSKKHKAKIIFRDSVNIPLRECSWLGADDARQIGLETNVLHGYKGIQAPKRKSQTENIRCINASQIIQTPFVTFHVIDLLKYTNQSQNVHITPKLRPCLWSTVIATHTIRAKLEMRACLSHHDLVLNRRLEFWLSTLATASTSPDTYCWAGNTGSVVTIGFDYTLYT